MDINAEEIFYKICHIINAKQTERISVIRKTLSSFAVNYEKQTDYPVLNWIVAMSD